MLRNYILIKKKYVKDVVILLYGLLKVKVCFIEIVKEENKMGRFVQRNALENMGE